jgi:hypothetical protein
MTSYQVLSDGRIVYPALVLFEQANYIDWINFCYLYTVTDQNKVPLPHVTC